MAAALKEESSENKYHFINSDKVIDLLKLTLKVVIIINGGAAIAVLTLTGSVLSMENALDRLPFISAAIGLFGFGVLIGVIAVATGYRSMMCGARFEYYAKRATTKEKLSKKARKKYLSKADKWINSCIKIYGHADVLVNVSFLLFGIGVACCVKAFLP